MSHDADKECFCVRDHRPPYLELEEHHIFPIYLGGSKTGPTVFLCGTTHTNVHELIRMFLRYGNLSYRQMTVVQDRPVSLYAYNLAKEGYTEYLAFS